MIGVLWNIFDDLSVCLCESIPNRLLNHATQRDRSLYKGVNKSRNVIVNSWKFFERDSQSNSKKF